MIQSNNLEDQQVEHLRKASDHILQAVGYLSPYAQNLTNSEKDRIKLQKIQKVHDSLVELSKLVSDEMFARVKTRILSKGKANDTTH